jgi:hypothetical protein
LNAKGRMTRRTMNTLCTEKYLNNLRLITVFLPVLRGLFHLRYNFFLLTLDISMACNSYRYRAYCHLLRYQALVLAIFLQNPCGPLLIHRHFPAKISYHNVPCFYSDVWACDDINIPTSELVGSNVLEAWETTLTLSSLRLPSTSASHGEYPNPPFPPTHRERQKRVCTQASGSKTYRDPPGPAPKVRNGCTHWPFLRSDAVILELHARLGSLGFLWRSGYYSFSA